jgi:hypothetical protein
VEPAPFVSAEKVLLVAEIDSDESVIPRRLTNARSSRLL